MEFQPFDDSFIDQWVLLRDAGTSNMLNAMIKNTQFADAPFNTGLGFVYVDHTCGITASMDYLLELDVMGNMVAQTHLLVEDGLGVRYRYRMFEDLLFCPVSEGELARFGLNGPPDWLEIYRNPVGEFIRSQKLFDSLRAPGFPDDLRFLLVDFQRGLNPEEVWGRFKGMTEEREIVLELLNQPYQDFGTSTGELLTAGLHEDGDELLLVWNGGVVTRED